MKAIFIYFISIFCINCHDETTVTVRTYKYEYTSTNNEKLFDYIQFTYKNNSIVKGEYYGNENDIHFVADIKFKKNIQNDLLSFSLDNYRFCDESSNPFQKTKCFKMKSPPFEVKDGPGFLGNISGEQLILKRVFWYYDSKFDKMTFTLVKED